VVYKGRLRCGSERVARRRCVLPDPQMALEDVGKRNWLRKVLDTSTTAIMLSTSALGSIAHDSCAGALPQNDLEARLALELTHAFLRAGLPGREMALLSPYRQQNKVLADGLEGLQENGTKAIEVLTADRAQGRDYEVVVVSLVRANDEGHVCISFLYAFKWWLMGGCR
jgi:DNA replication ATP-dependent helicase Dna2